MTHQQDDVLACVYKGARRDMGILAHTHMNIQSFIMHHCSSLGLGCGVVLADHTDATEEKQEITIAIHCVIIVFHCKQAQEGRVKHVLV